MSVGVKGEGLGGKPYILEAATGAMVLQWMLYFSPSLANELLKAASASLATQFFVNHTIIFSHDFSHTSAVVGLSKVAVQTSSRSRHDDTTVLLLSHNGEGGLGDRIRALDVNGVHEVPIGVGHACKGLVTKNTSIVDENVHAAKGLHGSVDNLLAIGDRVVIGHRLTACLANFFHNDIGSIVATAIASVRDAQVIDYDAGAARGKVQRVCSTKTWHSGVKPPPSSSMIPHAYYLHRRP